MFLEGGSMKKCFIIIFMLGISSAGTFLTNGDFEQELNIGWEQITNGSNIIINRATNYDPDPDYEAYVYKGTGSGYAKLHQIVNIPTTDLEFSVYTKLYAYDNHTSAWCGAAVVIAYLDESGSLLGDTRICARSTQCPWSNTSTHHIIEATDSLWHNYAFSINDELTNLPGVNPSAIKKIDVALFDTSYHC